MGYMSEIRLLHARLPSCCETTSVTERNSKHGIRSGYFGLIVS